MEPTPKPQTPTTGLNALAGTWPGDETEAELLEELGMSDTELLNALEELGKPDAMWTAGWDEVDGLPYLVQQYLPVQGYMPDGYYPTAREALTAFVLRERERAGKKEASDGSL